MWKNFYYILLLLSLINNPFSCFAQFQQSHSSQEIDVQFLKHQIEIVPATAFFNTLTIRNNGRQTKTINVDISVPAGWNLISGRQSNIVIAPQTEIIVPVRVAAANNTYGDIGYVVVATISESSGDVLTSEYCFVTVPKLSNLQMKIASTLVYYEIQTGKAICEVSLKNEGNINEIVYIDVFTNEFNNIIGEKDNFFQYEVSIAPMQDTVVLFEVFATDLLEETYNNLNTIEVKVHNLNTVYHKTVWLKSLQPTFTNFISSSEKCLIAELSIQDLFKTTKPQYSLNISGNLLLKNQRSFVYHFTNYPSSKSDNLWKYSKFLLKYNDKNISVVLGDVVAPLMKSEYARGVQFTLNYNSHKIQTTASENVLTNRYLYNLMYQYNISKISSIISGFTYSNSKDKNFQNGIGMLGTRFFIKKHSLYFLGGYSFSALNMNLLRKNYSGFGIYTNHSYTYKNFSTINDIKYGSPTFWSNIVGKTTIQSNSSYSLSNGSRIILSYNAVRYQPALYDANFQLLPKKYNYTNSIFVEYGYNLKPKLYGYFQTVGSYEKTNSYSLFQDNQSFATGSYGVKFGVRLRGLNKNLLHPSLQIRNTNVQKYANTFNNETIDENNLVLNYVNAKLSFQLMRNSWGVFFDYNYGPQSIGDQIIYFYYDKFASSVRFAPYYEDFIYRKKLYLSARGSYANSLNNKMNRVSTLVRLSWFFKNDWTLSFSNSYSMINQEDAASGAMFTYPNNYAEIVVRKEFNCQQPRLKYYDLQIIFFKDLNGNGTKDPNEGGVANVLANFEQIIPADSVFTSEGSFTPTELLSDQLGTIIYENIPEGNYQIRLTPLGNNSRHLGSNVSGLNISVAKDEIIYVPFQENNKIFGKLVLNRSSMSRLGTVSPANVKITAEDTRGNIFSTLTDAYGNFILYVPSTDIYIVRINNVFYQNFDLQQQEFVVKFNGYRQFELTYIFNEKQRQVNFNNGNGNNNQLNNNQQVVVQQQEVQETHPEVLLTGQIRDSLTGMPIKAEIEVINPSTLASYTVTSDATGNYNLSFPSDRRFAIAVKADQYWFTVSEIEILDVDDPKTRVVKNISMVKVDDTEKVILDQITFEKGSARLRAESFIQLDGLVAFLKANPFLLVEISGHTDATGTQAINIELSQNRARAVVVYLKQNGIPNDRVSFKGYADSQPIDDNSTEEGRQRNRRVEIQIIDTREY